MEQLPNGFTLSVPADAFPLSTDSMVLARFARLPRNAHVLDLGSGCGTLGLLLCASDPGCHVTGLEISAAAHAAAEENILSNGLQARMKSICADLRSVSSLPAPGSMDVCISNPPYFSGGPESVRNPAARREDHCTAEDLFAAAARSLKYGGDLFLVHRPERLGDLIARAASHGLEAKRLLLLRHRADGPIALIFLSFRKGGKPGLILEEQALHDTAGEATAFFREVYHI